MHRSGGITRAASAWPLSARPCHQTTLWVRAREQVRKEQGAFREPLATFPVKQQRAGGGNAGARCNCPWRPLWIQP